MTKEARNSNDPNEMAPTVGSCFVIRASSFIRHLVLLGALSFRTVHADSVLNSKHNLSSAGSATIKAVTETEVCIFCHTPHGASAEAPLWNRFSSGATYIPYSSTTSKATIGQPTGASKLCLSCHDGTVALGMVRNRSTPIKFQSEVTVLPAGTARLGTDLADDHPVSFLYDSALASAHGGELRDPSTLTGPVRLDKSGQLQCTSCHDPHDNQFGKFLVQKNAGSALCATCHAPSGWDQSIHKTSTATWNGQSTSPWPHTSETTVAANACENCHTPHNAGTKPRLLNFAGNEQNCYSCHNGNVAAKNVQSEFNKFSAHPIETTGHLHDEAEDPINPVRHVTCVDCHNPHAVKSTPAAVPNAVGALAGVKGMDASGALLPSVTKEFELCFRCHAESHDRAEALVPRQFAETNTRLEFSPANASYHPIETQGRNSNVPSLIAPWTTSSLMYCTDCHNSNDGPGAGGTGPKGPHGSTFAPLLERQLLLTDDTAESAATYALCYKCHSRTSILNNDSFQGIKGHKEHVVDLRNSCATCHDPHGVQAKSSLINFNRTYVTASSNGRLEFNSTGLRQGNCSLTCHGHDHNMSSYGPLGSPAPARLRLVR